MPPKRRQAASSASASKPPRQLKQSKLAKEHNISASVESECKEAFSLFSEETKSYPDAKEGMLPTPSLRRALAALGTPPSSAAEVQELMEAVDPDNTGFCEYENFVAIAALKMHARSEDSRRAEVAEAFKLFVGKSGAGGGPSGKITLGTLRRVARELKEDVGEQLLRDMILEANGGDGVAHGIGLGDFEEVMRRAGVFN